MMTILAKLLARPAVVDWLIRRAERTPYYHITSADGSDVYMYRWWLFNSYPNSSDGASRRWSNWLPSIRMHRIMRADQERNLHDHPWNARTFILRGWYKEEREEECGRRVCPTRRPGDTARLQFGQFHRITEVSEDGVWTLFVAGKKRGTWGFKVGDKKVPWRTYLGIEAEQKPERATDQGAA